MANDHKAYNWPMMWLKVTKVVRCKPPKNMAVSLALFDTSPSPMNVEKCVIRKNQA